MSQRGAEREQRQQSAEQQRPHARGPARAAGGTVAAQIGGGQDRAEKRADRVAQAPKYGLAIKLLEQLILASRLGGVVS